MNTIIFFGLLILVITLEACVDVFTYKSWTEKKQPWGWMYHVVQIVYAITLLLFGYWLRESIYEPTIGSWLIILFAAGSVHIALFDRLYNFIMYKDVPTGSTSFWDVLKTKLLLYVNDLLTELVNKIGIHPKGLIIKSGGLLMGIIQLILVFISAILVAGVMKDVIYL
jgi:hypothetical protein